MSDWRSAVVRECPNGCGAKVTWAKPSTTGRGYYADFDLFDPYRRHACGPLAVLDSGDPEQVREYLNAAIEASAREALREQDPARATPGLPPARIAELTRQRAERAQPVQEPKPAPRPAANVTPPKPARPALKIVES